MGNCYDRTKPGFLLFIDQFSRPYKEETVVGARRKHSRGRNYKRGKFLVLENCHYGRAKFGKNAIMCFIIKWGGQIFSIWRGGGLRGKCESSLSLVMIKKFPKCMSGKFEKFSNWAVMVTCGLWVEEYEWFEVKVLGRVKKHVKDKMVLMEGRWEGKGGSQDH